MDGTARETSLTFCPTRRSAAAIAALALQHTFIDLGMSPLCESFLTERSSASRRPTIPLHVRVCHACWLVQLPEFVSPAAHLHRIRLFLVLFDQLGGARQGATATMIKARLELTPNSFVVELGSNDGYLLQHFIALGHRVLGIEPAANVAEAAAAKGVPTRVAFFGTEVAREVVGRAWPRRSDRCQ